MTDIRIPILPYRDQIVRRIVAVEGTKVHEGEVLCEIDASEPHLDGVVVELPAFFDGTIHWHVSEGSKVDHRTVLGSID